MLRRLLIAPLALATGCTLLTSLDGLSGGPEPTVDAASIDVSTNETAPPLGDGGEAGADATIQGCASLGNHTFCDDFDDTTMPIRAGWDMMNTATLMGDTSLFVSPPRVVFFALPQGYPMCTYAELERSFPGKFHRARVSMSMRIGAPDGNTKAAGAYVMGLAVGAKCTIFFAPQASQHSAYLQNDPSGQPGESYQLSASLAPGSWKRVTAQFDTTTSPYVLVDIDGTNVLTLESIPAVCQLEGNAKVSIGPHCATLGSALEVRMDDVTIDVE